ncbi:MAG: PEP-CTERM sorting domain-containing protein [Phenylobacterium sp.]|uniref:PEPxxWA-CTERM sorting domain-containing protein n=1 Tax=Phenylobacterium sp. TaxID=1871053 RepID=UPI001A47003C|nr:PEPxxWA-CTERM sorting domain-containing protein [Phenylobacterium sp.]MBL8770136.1 PEP-CTERM sorting domain-containing protein [Phenylobacterium sp.]
MAVLIAAALACAAQPAAARVTIVRLTGVANGTDNGHLSAPSPFGVRQLVVGPTGATLGFVEALPFTLEVRIDESLGGLDLFPTGQDRYGDGPQSPVTAIFTMNGFSHAFGNLHSNASKGFGAIDSFYVQALEQRQRPPMTGAFTNVTGDLSVTMNLRSQVFSSYDYAEPASWIRGPGNARGDAAFGSLSLAIQDTTGSPFAFVLGPERTANLDLRIDSLTVSAAVPEPATWLVLILGFGAAGCALRRRAGRTAVV